MDIPRHWRLKKQRYALEGTRCTACGTVAFPPRRRCRDCQSRDSEPVGFAGTGTLYSYTVVYSAPQGYGDQSPYAVALVDLDEGPRLTAMLTDVDLDTLQIGLPVEMVTRRLVTEGDDGVIQYGYKFRPRDAL